MEWIHLDDRKPPDDEFVLIIKEFRKRGSRGVEMQITTIAARMNYRWIGEDDVLFNSVEMWGRRGTIQVTHWMYLPNPPELRVIDDE